MNGFHDITRDAGTNVKPRFQEEWDKYYQKYAVTKVDYKITLWLYVKINEGEVESDITNPAMGMEVFHGVFASARPAPASKLDLHDYVGNRLQRERVPTIHTDLNGVNRGTVIHGSYVPGSTNHEIRQDSDIEQWTSVGSNPSYVEYLCVYVAPEYPVQILVSERPRIKALCEFSYTTQYKDLKDEWKYRNFTEPGVGSNGSGGIST